MPASCSVRSLPAREGGVDLILTGELARFGLAQPLLDMGDMPAMDGEVGVDGLVHQEGAVAGRGARQLVQLSALGGFEPNGNGFLGGAGGHYKCSCLTLYSSVVRCKKKA